MVRSVQRPQAVMMFGHAACAICLVEEAVQVPVQEPAARSVASLNSADVHAVPWNNDSTFRVVSLATTNRSYNAL